MKEPAGRVRYLELDEIRRLGECIDRRGGHLQLLFRLAICTGARASEPLSGTWRNLRFERLMVTVLQLENATGPSGSAALDNNRVGQGVFP